MDVYVGRPKSDYDQHVVPADQEHDAEPSCWCQPKVTYEDLVTGGRVWLHRRSHDHGHQYRDDEG